MAQELLGLCMTCIHREVCTSRKGYKPPVFHCEEFDCGATEQVRETAVAREKDTSAGDEAGSTARIGLCATCENRDSCALSASPGGVWHCEEYR
jgi:hypothetical protein